MFKQKVNFILWMVTAIAVTLMAIESASAMAMHDEALDQQLQDIADLTVGGVFLMDLDGNLTLSTVTNINESWGIMTDHQRENSGTPYEVAFLGNAYTTETRSLIDYYVENPFGDDFILVHYETPLTEVPTNTIGEKPEIGDEGKLTGCGTYGTKNNVIGQDGNTRGGYGYVTDWSSIDIFSVEWVKPYYPEGHELGVLAMNKDSGGNFSDSDGDLTGLLISRTSSAIMYGIASEFLDLTAPHRLTFIEETTYLDDTPDPPPQVPEPATLWLFMLGLFGIAYLKGRNEA